MPYKYHLFLGLIVTNFVTLGPIQAFATENLIEGQGIRFQSSLILHKGKEGLRRFCDGQEVRDANTSVTGVCCNLELRSSWNKEFVLSTEARQIRWVAPMVNKTYLDIEVLASEITDRDQNDQSLRIRCDSSAPTWESLSLAFGGLISKATVHRSRFDIRSGSGYKAVIESNDSQYRPEFLNNEKATFGESAILLITHANPMWDRPRTTESGLANSISFAKRNGIPSFALVASQTHEPYLFAPSDVNHIVKSEAGQLQLKFPRARNIIAAGGNLRLCLCETIRDSVRSALSENSTVNVYIVVDAIYDAAADNWPHEQQVDAKGHTEKSRWASPLRTWDDQGRIAASGQWVDTGADGKDIGNFRLFYEQDLYAAEPNHVSFIKNFEQTVLNVRFNSLCDAQNAYLSPELDPKLMSYEIYDGTNQKILAAKNKGPHLSVRFIITNSKDLDRVFNFWNSKTGPS